MRSDEEPLGSEFKPILPQGWEPVCNGRVLESDRIIDGLRVRCPLRSELGCVTSGRGLCLGRFVIRKVVLNAPDPFSPDVPDAYIAMRRNVFEDAERKIGELTDRVKKLEAEIALQKRVETEEGGME